MSFVSSTGMAAAAAFLAASPAPSTSPLAANPIAIVSCDSQTMHNGMGFGNMTVNGHAVNFLKIGFTNAGKTTADLVTFQIDFNRERLLVDDVGSYAPGTTVTHTFRDNAKNAKATPNPAATGPIVCAVAAAHFTDGTTYNAPVVPLVIPSPTASPKG